MAIEVLCPNGHRLKCPDDRAGMRGKCPKCGTSFQVPKLNGDDASDSGLEENVASGSDSESRQVDATSDSGRRKILDAAPSDRIEFLCPNGHKLNGPATLQGQNGQCPHCHAKFRIPHWDEQPEDEDEHEESQAEEDEPEEPLLAELGEDPTSGLDLGDDEPDVEADDDDFLGLEDLAEVGSGSGRGSHVTADASDFLAGSGSIPSLLSASPGGVEWEHPLASLFVTLWQEREHGGVVELHLSGGVMVVPDWWAPGLSLQSHGVFAIQTPDSSYVMEAVAWASIERVTIRRIQELPDGVFE